MSWDKEMIWSALKDISQLFGSFQTFFSSIVQLFGIKKLIWLISSSYKKKTKQNKTKKTHKKNVLRCSQGQWNVIRCILRRSQWREKQTITFSYFLFSSKIKARYEPSDNKQNVWYLSSGHNFGTEDVNILIRLITILFVIIVEKPFKLVFGTVFVKTHLRWSIYANAISGMNRDLVN